MFLRLGGNALIEEGLANEYYASQLRSKKVYPNGPTGFVAYGEDAPEVARHAPTQRQRLRILKRDGCRCQVCGERPSDNVHVTLHVHHVRPFGHGGLTADRNLITLCHTCHLGLDPHEDLFLFFLPGGQFDRAMEAEGSLAFSQGIQSYRTRVAELLSKQDSKSK